MSRWVSIGKISGIGLRELRSGRNVDVRSSFTRVLKTTLGWSRLAIGLDRKESCDSFGKVASGAMSLILLISLNERSS